MEQKEMAKMRLIIYVLMAYGLTYLMGNQIINGHRHPCNVQIIYRQKYG